MDKQVRVRVPDELKERFDKVCAENHINASALIRDWIRKFVEENENRRS